MLSRRDIHSQQDRGRPGDGHRDRDIRLIELEPGIKPFHVLYRIDGDSPLTDLTEDARDQRAPPGQGRAVESRTEPLVSLVPREIMKPLIRVLSHAKTRKQPSGLFYFFFTGGPLLLLARKILLAI